MSFPAKERVGLPVTRLEVEAWQRTSCAGKERHADIGTARRHSREQEFRVVAYSCRFCGGFHLGHALSFEALQRQAEMHRAMNDGTVVENP